MTKTMMLGLLFFACAIGLTSCNSEVHNASARLPRNLSEALLYLKQDWPASDLERFKKQPERDAVTDSHFGKGLWIRNHWIRGGRDTALVKYFVSIGVHSADDMSSIILTSLHRSLNKKDIDLNGQVEEDKAYWKLVIDCAEEERKEAVAFYSKSKVGDLVKIYMPVDTSYNNMNAVQYQCPNNEWTFNAQKDLFLKGKITEKYFINSPENVFVKVQIISMSQRGIKIFSEEANVGKILNFGLAGLRIK
ncbi:DUF6794 domain-containing protein [Mucilaginibacter sp. AW1-7]|jgi:hypothetical protein|uniref:DUF6794 domain-containing protein n=1 Tax=Mucilaginibacter sp. AW1-7 TaxID=3349874 RepID=UPI003F7331FE